ncbi:odorant receptor 131-2-like [Anguilla anguilla]|uniref:odorant receptor 131-2-like n=1 Tax=Anguilla anguilla TaxID=7936 RepID=UPI0015A7848E|nr:odorant receptor 131-2-like [Anguilla anguilla]
MSSSTYLYTNITTVNRGVPVKAVLSMTPTFFFLYVNIVMLFTLRCKVIFRETSRYILFANMLFVDTLSLLICVFLYILAVGRLYFSGIACLVVVVSAGALMRISPLNLAMMSLERYAAICFPLRHVEIITCWRTGGAIIVMWVVGSLNSFADLLTFVMAGSNFGSTWGFCSRNLVFPLKVYNQINTAFSVIYFLMVGVIIIYTYISITMVAKSATSDKISATKANKTVLLHLFQLGIYLASLLHEPLLIVAFMYMDRISFLNVQYVLFVTLLIFPRCLSPLIYGLRDQIFSPIFLYNFTFSFRGTVKPVMSA